MLSALQADPTFTVSVLARQSSTSTAYPASIRVFKVDDSYPVPQLRDAFAGQDAVICVISLKNIPEQLKFIECAVDAGVKVFIPAEFGGNKEVTGGMQHGEELPSHGGKDVVLDHLRKAEAKGLSWTAVATGPFVDW